MMTATLDPYQILMVAPGADAAEVRAAFLRLIRGCHPDRSSAADASARAATVIEAYRALSGRERRRNGPDKRRPGGAAPAVERRRGERRGRSVARPRQAWDMAALAWAIAMASLTLGAARLLPWSGEEPVELSNTRALEVRQR